MNVDLSKDDCEKMVRLFIMLAVQARHAQHIAWEMQYTLNELEEFDVSLQKITAHKNKIFDEASNIGTGLPGRFKAFIPDSVQVDCKGDNPMTFVYDNATRKLQDMDETIRQEADRLYEEMNIKFNKNWCDECRKSSKIIKLNRMPISDKID